MRAYLLKTSIMSCVDLPFSFCSRLIRVAAADTPMKRAKMGSATREMIYVGAGMFAKVGWCVIMSIVSGVQLAAFLKQQLKSREIVGQS